MSAQQITVTIGIAAFVIIILCVLVARRFLDDA